MGSRRADRVHYGGRGWLTVGCGHLARGRRRTLETADVGCEECRASDEFKAAERSAAKLSQFQERCASQGHVRSRDASDRCVSCAIPLGVRHG